MFKAALSAIILLSSLSSFAAETETKLKAKTIFTRADGAVQKLPSVRIQVYSHDNASILDIEKSKDCIIEIGKKDALSLWTDTTRWSCVRTGNSIIISEETLEDIATQSAVFSFRGSFFDKIETIFRMGKITKTDAVSTNSSVDRISRLLRSVFDSATKTYTIKIGQVNNFEIVDRNEIEKFNISIETKRINYL